MDGFSIGARMRGARHMAGMKGVPALAAELKRRGTKRGLGQTKLYAFEQDREVPDVRDLIEIANACGVELAFFTADFARLGEISDDPRRVLAAEIAAAVERAAARRAGNAEDHRPPLEEVQ